MKFFTPEDFNDSHMQSPLCSSCSVDAADLANAKLERDGKVVYANSTESHDWWIEGIINKDFKDGSGAKYKALLVYIKPIEKCEHPLDKCYWTGTYIKSTLEKNTPLFKCECGNEVTPKSFGACDSEAEEVRE